MKAIFSKKALGSHSLTFEKKGSLFSASIQAWYLVSHRRLPWRDSVDPYRVWVSEMILQQTQVRQALPYYTRIIDALPTLASFARASEADILRLWQGMGYYRRALYMHATAKTLMAQHKGLFPRTPEALRQLKGIGPYTAAAIASFAFNVAAPVLDGNVFRLIARVFGLTDDTTKPATRLKFETLLEALIDQKNPGRFNQALMEMGALICTPNKPKCHACCIQKICVAHQTHRTHELPISTKKKPLKTRYIHYVVFIEKNQTERYYYLRKRQKQSIWALMYDFYSIENSDALWNVDTLKKALAHSGWAFEESDHIGEALQYKHLLTHLRLHVRFFPLIFKPRKQAHEWLLDQQKLVRTPHQNLDQFPKPTLIQNYLQDPNNKPIFNDRGGDILCNLTQVKREK